MARNEIKADTANNAEKPMPAMYRLNDGDGLHLLFKPENRRGSSTAAQPIVPDVLRPRFCSTTGKY